jgi:hypothetical protein
MLMVLFAGQSSFFSKEKNDFIPSVSVSEVERPMTFAEQCDKSRLEGLGASVVSMQLKRLTYLQPYEEKVNVSTPKTKRDLEEMTLNKCERIYDLEKEFEKEYQSAEASPNKHSIDVALAGVTVDELEIANWSLLLTWEAFSIHPLNYRPRAPIPSQNNNDDDEIDVR